MTGRWYWPSISTSPTTRNDNSKYIRATLWFKDDSSGSPSIHLSDSRKMATLAVMTGSQLQAKLSKLGPDLLSLALSIMKNRSYFNSAFHSYLQLMVDYKRRKKQICQLLMDQELYCGIGNYLKAEILYACQLAPNHLAEDITIQQWHLVFYYSLRKIYESYRSGGLTIANYTDTQGRVGNFTKVVYKCERCPLGHEVVTGKFKDGRTTYWVPEIQK